jgi:hypothetical protein
MMDLHRLVACVLASACTSALPACNDAFDGANVQFDFSPAMPVQATYTAATPGTGEVEAASHFTFYAIQIDGEAQTSRLYAITQFEIHHIVDLSSPCFIDVGDHVPHPGLHVSQYATVIGQDTGIPDVTMPPAGASDTDKIEAATADQREADVALLAGPNGLHAVTSASTAVYPPVAATCAAAAADATMIPPPTCTDDASNAQRLALCQAAWAANPGLWEGTDRILTSPLAGTTAGFVDGANPITLSPVGGAQFFVDTVLRDADAFAVYSELDGSDGTGEQLLYGTPKMLTRGVLHVHMTNAVSTAITADVAIFADLDSDDSQF